MACPRCLLAILSTSCLPHHRRDHGSSCRRTAATWAGTWNQPQSDWLAYKVRVRRTRRCQVRLSLCPRRRCRSMNHVGVLLRDAVRWLWRTDNPARAFPFILPATRRELDPELC